MTRKLIAVLAVACCVATGALALSVQEYVDPTGTKSWGAIVFGYVDGSGRAQSVSAANPLPVTGGVNTSPTDRSGTITLGGLAQTLMSANTSRHGCSLQNQSSNDLWIVSPGTAAAVQPSTWLPAGAYYTCPTGGTPTGAFSIFGATTGQTFAAAEW